MTPYAAMFDHQQRTEAGKTGKVNMSIKNPDLGTTPTETSHKPSRIWVSPKNFLKGLEATLRSNLSDREDAYV